MRINGAITARLSQTWRGANVMRLEGSEDQAAAVARADARAVYENLRRAQPALSELAKSLKSLRLPWGSDAISNECSNLAIALEAKHGPGVRPGRAPAGSQEHRDMSDVLAFQADSQPYAGPLTVWSGSQRMAVAQAKRDLRRVYAISQQERAALIFLDRLRRRGRLHQCGAFTFVDREFVTSLLPDRGDLSMDARLARARRDTRSKFHTRKLVRRIDSAAAESAFDVFQADRFYTAQEISCWAQIPRERVDAAIAGAALVAQDDGPPAVFNGELIATWQRVGAPIDLPWED